MFVRVAQFTFRAGTEENGLSLLREDIAFIAKSPGCKRAYLATPIHGPSFMVYSEWDSEADIERFEGAMRMNPGASSTFFGLMPLLQGPAHIARYEVVP